MKFHIVTLGCPKNQVDSEGMAQLLIAAGHEPAGDARQADALIVNTCGFIAKAREESMAQLRQLAALKRRTAAEATRNGDRTGASKGRKLLIAAGCLSQRDERELLARVPELDGLLGTLRWGEISELLSKADDGARPCWTGHAEAVMSSAPRAVVRAPSAYLKIADGCDATCAFCAIPTIKGPQRSKPLEAVLAEARALAAQGVKEIVLVAQDTTAYGADRGERNGFADLLRRLAAEVPGVPWLRVMYAHPAHIGDRLLATMAELRQIVKYLDLPLQHAHPDVLQRMRRPLNGRQVVARIREAMPDVALRSAFIVGFPGETEREFRELLAFLEELRFDRVGIFSYSLEAGTAAADLTPHVPERVKRTRFGRAMALQQRISLAKNRALIGRELEVLVEGSAAPGQVYGAVGRSYRDAPEVDGLVLIKQHLPTGTIAKVRVTEAMPYDLAGEPSSAVELKAEEVSQRQLPPD